MLQVQNHNFPVSNSYVARIANLESFGIIS